MKFISVCPLDSEQTKEQFLKNLGISGQRIKKSELKRKELQRKVGKEEKYPLDLINHNQIASEYHGEEFKVLCEAKDWIAFSKPKNAHSVVQRYSDHHCLVNWLYANEMFALTQVNRNSLNRGVLNRLDQGTTGVLLYAKNDEFFRSFFATSAKLKKYYLCVVQNRPSEGELSLEYNLVGKKVKVEEGGVAGTMRIDVLEEKEGRFLLQIQLFEGLRHQIRAGLSSIGCPILGDELYGGASAQRLYLHSFAYLGKKIKAIDLTGFSDFNTNTQMIADRLLAL